MDTQMYVIVGALIVVALGLLVFAIRDFRRRRPSGLPKESSASSARRAAAIFLVAGAVAALLLLQPDDSYDSQRREIGARYEHNMETSESAPQQDVANGVATSEYLALLSAQQESSDNRRDALLLLLVAGIAIAAARRA